MIERLSNDTKVDLEQLPDDQLITLIAEREQSLSIQQLEPRREALQSDIGKFATELSRRQHLYNPECGILGY